MKNKNEKSSTKEEQQDEKTGTVDQIKKKYGFSKSSNVSTLIAFFTMTKFPF